MSDKSDKLKILLLTDFTEASVNAMEYVVKLFSKWYDDEITYLVLHAFKPMTPYVSTPSIPVIRNDAMEEEYRNNLKATVEALKEIAKSSARIQPFFEKGALNIAVKKIVEEEDPDLIVMGSREKSTFERMTLGSNTIEVSNNAKRPVLAVPREADQEIPQRILLVGESERLEIPHRTLKFIKELVNSSNADFKVLHVYKSGTEKELLEKMKDTVLHKYLSNVEHKHQPIVSSNPLEAMVKYAEDHKPNLLIANPSEKGFFEKIFHTGITEKMVYHTQVPILILNII